MVEKILIVEDEPVAAENIRLTIEQAGYEYYGIAPSNHKNSWMLQLAVVSSVEYTIYDKR